jgi:hypothetical protein
LKLLHKILVNHNNKWLTMAKPSIGKRDTLEMLNLLTGIKDTLPFDKL